METKIRTVNDLKVYESSFSLAMDVFELTKRFPREEASLTDQIRRSSRSVAVNIREGFAKRKYEQVFIRQLVDAKGSAEETRAWLDFAVGSRYITEQEHAKLDQEYDTLGAMLFSLIKKWSSSDVV